MHVIEWFNRRQESVDHSEREWNVSMILPLPEIAVVAAFASLAFQGGGMLAQDARPAKSSPLAFEVASVKPHEFARGQFAFRTASLESDVRISGNRVTTQGLLAGLIMTAYKLRTFQVSGAPEWLNETGRYQLYDIEARVAGDGVPTMDEVRKMLQTLLAERFQLKFHRETK